MSVLKQLVHYTHSWNVVITEKGARYDYIGLTGQAADL